MGTQYRTINAHIETIDRANHVIAAVMSERCVCVWMAVTGSVGALNQKRGQMKELLQILPLILLVIVAACLVRRGSQEGDVSDLNTSTGGTDSDAGV